MKKIKILIVLSFVLSNISIHSFASDNLGHRGGCDLFVFSDINRPADNSIECLKLVKEHENNPQLKYLEFDVWEIKENGLLVMHGGNKTIGGRGYIFIGKHNTVSFDKGNRDICNKWVKADCKKNMKLSAVTLDEVQQLLLNDSFNQNPASLSKYIDKIIELEIKTPIIVDIKSIYSEQAVESLFKELFRLKDQVHKNNLDENMFNQGIAIWAKRKSRYHENHDHICKLSDQYKIGVYYKKSEPLCSKKK